MSEAIMVLEAAYGPTAEGPWETRTYTTVTSAADGLPAPYEWTQAAESGWGWRKPEQKFWRWRVVPYVPESAQPAERAGEWVNIVGPNGTVAANEGETYLFAIEVSTNGGKPHWEYFTDAIVWDAETDPDWSSGEHGWDINDELWFRPLPPPPHPKEKP